MSERSPPFAWYSFPFPQPNKKHKEKRSISYTAIPFSRATQWTTNHVLLTLALLLVLCPLLTNRYRPTDGRPLVVVESPYTLQKPMLAERQPINPSGGSFATKKQRQELNYMATLSVDQVFQPPIEANPPATYYDFLKTNKHCVTNDSELWECQDCFRRHLIGDCGTCIHKCGCIWDIMCIEKAPEPFVSMSFRVSPPPLRIDTKRLVPRIIHQTYKEELTADKYARLHRITQRFKDQGWDYRFYDDENARKFMVTHFPAQVVDAYDSLASGAYKADLFRYCVLLIHGGVYADVDMYLVAELEEAVPDDVGFLSTAVDLSVLNMYTEHGPITAMDNHFLASAPGHPFLSSIVELFVNRVRNRYNVIDYQEFYCPEPNYHILVLLQAGMLLAVISPAVNSFLGRPRHAPFVPGTLDLSDASRRSRRLMKRFGKTVLMKPVLANYVLPDKNLTVTYYDDTESKDAKEEGDAPHYTEIEKKGRDSGKLYGRDGLYRDQEKAYEDIRIVTAM